MNIVFPLPAAKPNIITQYAFRTRVGDQLVASMELAAADNPNDSAPVRMAKAVQRAAIARCYSAQYIDLDLQELREGFNNVTSGDYARIFFTPVRDEERP